MGCCTSKNATNTLRKEDPPVPVNEPKGKEQYQGKEAKEVVNDMEVTDMLIAVKTANF